MTPAARPTSIRYIILAITVLVAVLLYLDRFCLGFVMPYVRENFRLVEGEVNVLLGAFFYTYAVAQIAGGYLSDRFGTRMMLATYLAVWSVLTGLMGYADGFVSLLLLRFGCGLFEAGAYPACAGLIRRWIPYERRGLASGIVSIGGRLGGTVAPVVTAYLMFQFLPVHHPSEVTPNDLLNPRLLARDVMMLQPDPKKVPEIVKIASPRLQATLSPDATQTFLAVANLPDKTEATPEQKHTMAVAVNGWIGNHNNLATLELTPILPKLNNQARDLLWKLDRTDNESARLNRFLLEAMFPDSIRKILGDSWAPVLAIYGAIGVVLAVVFFFFFRDSPREHFMANEAEAALIEAEEKPAAQTGVVSEETAAKMQADKRDADRSLSAGALWLGIVSNLGLWASSVVQFGTNFGWIFLGSMMPLYLQRVYQVPELERGWMSSLPFFASLPMMIVGGAWTDWMTKKYGNYWGRCFPLGSTRLLAACMFVACIFLDDPWHITYVLCAFSVISDMGLPAIWAYNLDVGGKNVGLVLGWGNMWGNLGAAVSPMLLGFVLREFVNFDGAYTIEQAKAVYHAVFATCAAVFFVIGLVSFAVDARKKIGA